MADIYFNYSSLRRSSGNEPDSEQIHLTHLPRSRAPSYRSRASSILGVNDDTELLVEHVSKSEEDKRHELPRASTTRSSRKRKRRAQGWRFGVAVASITSGIVFLINFILTVWATVKFGPVVNGVGTAIVGDCDVVNNYTLWMHILINVLSSILLSASNYTMQCLTSPTRRECDKAHAQGDWLDIGVAGTRNLTRIRWHRGILWAVLALSSVPIHLLYNSAVFKSLQANTYTMVVANPDFLVGGNFTVDLGGEASASSQSSAMKQVKPVQDAYAARPSSFQNLEPAACIVSYGTDFVSQYDHLIAITNDRSKVANQTVFQYTGVNYFGIIPAVPSYSWICADTTSMANNYHGCDINTMKSNSSNWTLKGHRIDHCLARTTAPQCKLQFSPTIMAAVIICNVLKALAMLWTFWQQKEATLVTIGDAIASYLDRPDVYTKGRCLMGKVDVQHGPLTWITQRLINVRYGPIKFDILERNKYRRPNTQPPTIMYRKPLVRKWSSAASGTRWMTTLILCTATILTSAVLFSFGARDSLAYRGKFDTSFGVISSQSMFNVPFLRTSGLLGAILLANCPQAIVSFLYLMYNGLFTTMLLSHEWSKYGLRRKPLRVTTPVGDQRSTHYLQLPYLFSVPMVAASATLHWLISEAVFLARVDVFDNAVEDKDRSIVTCGYSILPTLLAILLGVSMVTIMVGMGFRKFSSHIPLAGSCSVAIAAACHRPDDDVDAAVLPVQWGEIVAEGTEEVGHCSFTSFAVQDLVPGRMYAGTSAPRRRIPHALGKFG